MAPDHRNPQAYRPPKVNLVEVRRRWECFYRGWQTRMDGGRRCPPHVSGSEDARQFCAGWDAADAEERQVEALKASLETS
jgi:predicted metal-binding protein